MPYLAAAPVYKASSDPVIDGDEGDVGDWMDSVESAPLTLMLPGVGSLEPRGMVAVLVVGISTPVFVRAGREVDSDPGTDVVARFPALPLPA